MSWGIGCREDSVVRWQGFLKRDPVEIHLQLSHRLVPRVRLHVQQVHAGLDQLACKDFPPAVGRVRYSARPMNLLDDFV